jgi:hypothetical protein
MAEKKLKKRKDPLLAELSLTPPGEGESMTRAFNRSLKASPTYQVSKVKDWKDKPRVIKKKLSKMALK